MINKNKNVNLQLTINKADYDNLLMIQHDLSSTFNIALTKSQTIAFLIKNYGSKSIINKSDVKPTPTTKEPTKSGINYSAQVKALKDKLGVSFTRLSEIIGIAASTLKKYANGSQNPSGENKELLLTALKNYGIK